MRARSSSRRVLAAVVALAAAGLAPRSAHADAVPAPPAQCPPGTRGQTNHVMQFCGPATCTRDAECRPDERCADYPLCVTRLVSESPRGNSYSAPVSGPCLDGRCEKGSCERDRHCVPSGFVPGAGSDTSAGADAGTAGPTGQPSSTQMVADPSAPGPAPVAVPSRPAQRACACGLVAGQVAPGATWLVGLLAWVAARRMTRRAASRVDARRRGDLQR